MCPHAVREWLVLLTMEMYMDRFMKNGYVTIGQCKLIVPRDLNTLGIYHRGHRKLLVDGVQLMNNAPERFICVGPCQEHHHSPILEKQERFQCEPESSEGSADSDDEVDNNISVCTVDDRVSRCVPVPTPSQNVNPNTSKNVYEVSETTLMSAINFSVSYTCVAFPDLAFRSTSELAEHIAQVEDGNTHKIAPPPSEAAIKLPNSCKMENPM